jgi:hypothetical protein
MKIIRSLMVASAAFFIVCSASAQNSGTVTSHAFAVGKGGVGTTGFTSLLCAQAQIAVGQSAADPICRTLSGDVTLDASGVTAIGANKVTNAMLATMSANTVKGSTAGGSPVDLSMPSCSSSANALIWTSGTGFGCNTISQGSNVQTVNYTVQQSDCGSYVQMGTGLSGFLTLTLPSAGSLSNGCKIKVRNGNGWGLGSGTGSTSGSSTALTLTGTPTIPPCVGCAINGSGIVGGTTVSAFNGTTGITLSSAMTVAGGTSLTWSAGDESVGLSNFPSDFTNGKGVLWPLQVGEIQGIGGVWVATDRPGRAKLPAGPPSVQLYTNFTSGSNSAAVNGCMGPVAKACQSLQSAMFMACNEFDFTSLPQSIINFNVAGNINDTAGVHYACHSEVGAQGGAALTITCGPNGTINTTGTDAFAIDVNATVSIVNCSLQASGSIASAGINVRPADCIRADFSAKIFALNNIMVNCTGSHYAADNNGQIFIGGNDTMNGSAARHFYAINGGQINLDWPPIQLTTTVAAGTSVGDAFAVAGPGGVINLSRRDPATGLIVQGWTFGGTVSGGFGLKVRTDGTGAVFTGVGTTSCNNSVFPGTANGTVTSPWCN